MLLFLASFDAKSEFWGTFDFGEKTAELSAHTETYSWASQEHAYLYKEEPLK